MELLDQIREIVLPLIEQNDCYLDDIEYVKDKNEMYLRIFIEKNNGYLDMDTCVTVSELISEKLDETDPIKDEYYLEVSSPGIEKPLKTFEQVNKSVGEYVYAKFKNPKNGLHEVEGYLKSVNGQELEFEYLVKNIKKRIIIDYDNIKFIRLAVKF
ncbi:ribosome maturation factor RimP [[Clostridium] spiroforme]|nr:ribosome maturation factor RimP [Thomasclavelia spiroformis]MBM6880402.1 ribosome maturation factor RimP [Thomasclavelia spiroformis]MBM6930483.1 ribosome maturation factor RimP [Thomasclavelia spiroformis]